MSGTCLFCAPRGVTRRNDLAYCTRDSYPVSPGHSLIIPLRHCASLFDHLRDLCPCDGCRFKRRRP